MPHIAIKKVSIGDPPPLEGTPADKIIDVRDTQITLYLLPGSMASGKSAVMLVADVADGKLVMETSLEILKVAVNGLVAMDAVGY